MCSDTIPSREPEEQDVVAVHLAEVQDVEEDPTPSEFIPSLPCVAIHCESKFCCDT